MASTESTPLTSPSGKRPHSPLKMAETELLPSKRTKEEELEDKVS
jgi:hypothetical protein